MAADQTRISAGNRDRVILLQRKLDPSPVNDLGEAIESWYDLGEIFADKQDDWQGAEAQRADEEAGQITASFVIGYPATLSPQLNSRDRLLYNPDPTQPASQGLIYNIRTVGEVGRRNGLHIVAWARSDNLPGPG